MKKALFWLCMACVACMLLVSDALESAAERLVGWVHYVTQGR